LDDKRQHVREIADQHFARGDALGWFETLYAEAAGDAAVVPWADLRPNPNLIDWLDRAGIECAGRSALVVGCGLGDDAEHLAGRGFRVTAFDISPTAIAWCRRRFPNSPVAYAVQDLFNPPANWQRAFDFVFEAYTLQALPATIRAEAMRQIASCVAGNGILLVLCRARDRSEPEDGPPWPLTREELETFTANGLVCEQFDDYFDIEKAAARRFRGVYRRRA
jgi:SAM-dependent methyltransferase